MPGDGPTPTFLARLAKRDRSFVVCDRCQRAMPIRVQRGAVRFEPGWRRADDPPFAIESLVLTRHAARQLERNRRLRKAGDVDRVEPLRNRRGVGAGAEGTWRRVGDNAEVVRRDQRGIIRRRDQLPVAVMCPHVGCGRWNLVDADRLQLPQLPGWARDLG